MRKPTAPLSPVRPSTSAIRREMAPPPLALSSRQSHPTALHLPPPPKHRHMSFSIAPNPLGQTACSHSWQSSNSKVLRAILIRPKCSYRLFCAISRATSLPAITIFATAPPSVPRPPFRSMSTIRPRTQAAISTLPSGKVRGAVRRQHLRFSWQLRNPTLPTTTIFMSGYRRKEFP